MKKIAEPRDGEPIRLVITANGEPRYRVRLDVGANPATGKRRQSWTTHSTLTAARAHVSASKSDRERGVLVAPSRQTFKEYAEGWHQSRARRIREVTALTYVSALNHAYAAFGETALAKVSRADVERVVNALTAAGRSKRTASLTLFVIRSVFEDALHDGLIVRNPAARVEATGREPKLREALTGEELSKLRAHLASDRLFACWLLTLAGLRRSEVLGLHWSDVDLAKGTLAIERGRVAVDGKRTAEGPTKTARGRRILPLPADVVSALKRLREEQAAEFGFEQARTGYLAVNEIGEPVRPERWTDMWREHSEAAKVSVVTLHAARHSSVTAMRDAGVPDHIVAAFHGHSEGVMRATYSHAHPEAMAAAANALWRAMSGAS
jgi:integrase